MSADLFQEGFGRGILNITYYAKTKQQQKILVIQIEERDLFLAFYV